MGGGNSQVWTFSPRFGDKKILAGTPRRRPLTNRIWRASAAARRPCLDMLDRLRCQCLDHRCRRIQSLPQMFHDLPDHSPARSREHEGILRTTSRRRKDNQIFREKLWLVRNGRSFQVDRLTEAPPTFFRDENNLV